MINEEKYITKEEAKEKIYCGYSLKNKFNEKLIDDLYNQFEQKISMLESQLVSEMKLNNSLNEQYKELRIWEFFASYLVDKKEGEIITEESIIQWLAEVMKEQNVLKDKR